MHIVICRDLLWELYASDKLTSQMRAFHQIWNWIRDGSIIGVIDELSLQNTERVFGNLVGIDWTEEEFQSSIQEIRAAVEVCPVSTDLQRQMVAIFDSHDLLRTRKLEDQLFVLYLACARVQDADKIVAYNPQGSYAEICDRYSIGLHSPSKLIQIIQLDRTVQFEHSTHLRNWLEQLYQDPWRSVRELHPVTSHRDLICGGYTQINWEIDGNPISMLLILQLLPQSSNQIDIQVQVRPYHPVYLPIGLCLTIFNESGDFWQEIQAEPDDYGIRFELTASFGDRFSIVVFLGDRCHREDFTV